MKRREFFRSAATGGAAAMISPALASAGGRVTLSDLKGNVNHSVCQWPYKEMALSDLVENAARIGIKSVELLGADDWPTALEAGLTCAMAYPPIPEGKNRLTDGFNRVVNHEWLVPTLQTGIRQAAEAGLPNVICFSGNREGLDDDEGLRICAEGVKQIAPIAEEFGVTVCMELLNSRVDHPDYQCDHTEWGVALVDMVGSSRFKLLYDIYHMQIMEGDVIRTIRDNAEYIAHYHTGGNPGRHEIDGTQELNYRAITEAILETGFEGYIAQEFIPTRDPMTSLAEAVTICDV